MVPMGDTMRALPVPNGTTLPACTLSVQSLYAQCSCGNMCVTTVAVLTPMLLLMVWEVWMGAHYLLCCRPAASSDDAADTSSQDAARNERAALTAIQMLPSMVWGGSPGGNCSLCLQSVSRGQVVRRLRCGHSFHLSCIDRWLIFGQRNHAVRCCPLCRSNPLVDQVRHEVFPVTDAITGTQTNETLGSRVRRIMRRLSEGGPRLIIGLQQRRHSHSATSTGASLLL